MRRILAGLVASLVLTGAAAAAEPAKAPSWRDFEGVENTSFVEADGKRVLQLSIVVKASPEEVYKAFTTAEGFKTWATPVAWVDLRIGGVIETSYNPDARQGDPENIKNRIEAYIPGRLLVLRNVQAPSGLKGRELFNQTVSISQFEDLGDGRTRVTITGVGYGTGGDFDVLYGHFEWGNAYSLAALKRRFDEGPIDWASVFEKQKAAAAARKVQGQ
jgi:uncharacterized protein YndB with AHSA1/START domain